MRKLIKMVALVISFDTPLFLEDDDSVLLVEIRRWLAGN